MIIFRQILKWYSHFTVSEKKLIVIIILLLFFIYVCVRLFSCNARNRVLKKDLFSQYSSTILRCLLSSDLSVLSQDILFHFLSRLPHGQIPLVLYQLFPDLVAPHNFCSRADCYLPLLVIAALSTIVKPQIQNQKRTNDSYHQHCASKILKMHSSLIWIQNTISLLYFRCLFSQNVDISF